MSNTQFKNPVLLTHLYPTEKTNEKIRAKYPDAIEVIISKKGTENTCVKATNEEMYMDIVKIWDNMVCEYIKVDTPCLFYLDSDLKSNRPYGVTYNGKDDSAKLTIDKEIKKNPFLSQYKYTYKIRETRLLTEGKDKGLYKHSYHIIFNDLPVVNNAEIKKYLMSLGYDGIEGGGKDIWDLTVYDAGRKMSSIYCTKSIDIPVFEPIGYEKTNPKLDLNNYFITNVGKDDIITKLPYQAEKKEEVKKETKKNDKQDNGTAEMKIKNFIYKFKVERSDNYDSWTKMVWCIIGTCDKEGVGMSKCSKLVHQFSMKSKKYCEDEVDTFFDTSYNHPVEKSLGWKYLYDCLKEDDLEYYESINTKTYYQTKKDFEKTHCKILHPPMICILTKDEENLVYSIKKCKESYEHIHCAVKTVKKGVDEYEDKEFISLWLKDKDIRRYDKIVFNPPPIITEKDEYNTWIDFKISKEPFSKTGRDYFAEYRTYLNNLVNNEAVANYILARYAIRFQKPAFRTEVCLIIYGSEGDGKNMLLSPIYKILDKYGLALDDANKLYEKHATYEKEKLFILVNEAGGNANFNNCEILKSRITDKELWVNPKGMDAYRIDNRCDYDMTTNNLNVVKLTDESHRRFLQVETTSYYQGNAQFFKDYDNDIINNPVALKQIYEGLMNFDVSTVIPSGNFQKDKPITEVSLEVKRQNRDKMLYFIEELVSTMLTRETFKVTNKELFAKWSRWLTANKITFEYNTIQFGIKFTTLIKKQLNINGVECVTRDPKHGTNTFYIDAFQQFFTKLNGVALQKKDEYIDETGE